MGMLVFGALLSVGGFAAMIYGDSVNNDFSAQLRYYLNGGSGGPGDIWTMLGGFGILVGIVLLICGLSQMKKGNEEEEIIFVQDKKADKVVFEYDPRFNKKMMKEYLQQLNNGVLTLEQYKEKIDALPKKDEN